MSLDVVKGVKEQLVAKGVDLSGPDGAFQITSRVAWALRADGAGILDKPTGNNSGGYAVDVVVYRDGTGYDVLIDGGGDNGPAWNKFAEPLDPSRWRSPFDPGDVEEVPPVVVPPTEGFDFLEWANRVEAKLDLLLAAPSQKVVFPPYQGKLFGVSFTLTPKKDQ